jgi:hypothetical protein
MIRIGDTSPIYGAVEPKPIVNLPSDAIRVRLRLRNKDFVHAFVKTTTGIERWIVAENANGEWFLKYRQSINRTVR